MNKAVQKLRDMANKRARDFSDKELQVIRMLPERDRNEFQSGKYSDFLTGAMMAALLISRGADLSELVSDAREVWINAGFTSEEFDRIHGDWIE